MTIASKRERDEVVQRRLSLTIAAESPWFGHAKAAFWGKAIGQVK
jgi:hypothetical protein